MNTHEKNWHLIALFPGRIDLHDSVKADESWLINITPEQRRLRDEPWKPHRKITLVKGGWPRSGQDL